MMAALLCGCAPRESVVSYTVSKPVAKDRMLAAIIDRGSQDWFFKLAGPDALVSTHRETFQTFLESIRFAKEQPSVPSWDLPEGWTQEQGSAMRHATIRIPSGETTLELTVVTLPRIENDETRFLLSNINRWRGQMGLSPMDPADLPASVTKLKLEEGSAVMVNLVGNLTPGAMR
jgi:hypothetical protein